MFTAYPAIFARDRSGTILVRFPDFDDATTEATDDAEAFALAVDCLDETIAYRIASRLALPRASQPRRVQRLVPVPALTAAKAALWESMRQSGATISDLARRLGIQTIQVRRLLDPRHRSRIDMLEAAMAALGRRLVIGAEPTLHAAE